MGFLSRAFRKNIMAPIGQPENVTGISPIFKRPEPFVRDLPIQVPPKEFIEEPLNIGGITPITRPLPPIQPPQLPPVTPPPILPPVITPPVARPVIPPQPPSIGGIGGINQNPRPLERPTILPRRDNFMSIERLPSPVLPITNPAPITEPFVPPVQPPRVPLSKRTDIFGQGKKYDPANLPEGFSFDRPSEGIYTSVMPPPGFVYAYGPNGERVEVPSGDRSGIAPVMNTVIEPAPTTPAAVATDVGAVPDTTMPIGAIDPVLLQQATAETLTDPLIRSLYFGTADSPGFFQQLQQAGANLIGSDVPLQQTAGLTPLEVLARQQAVAGIGGFEPFLQQNRELVNQAIAQSRRAEQLQDPYYTQAEQIYQDTMGAYDPSMTQQFFNPFEDAVVQQTISDVLEAGEQQDIAARAREIGAGAFGGSRARLGAMERREALGEGLAQALGRIRQQGFSEAQRTGLGEFARQQQAKRTGAQGLIGIGTGRGSAAGNLAQRLAGFGGQMTDLGRTQEALRSGQRGELAGFGATGRGIEETGLSRIYQQQLGQQQRPLGVLGQIGSMLPGYQASRTQIDSQYGMPTDPTAAGLGAAFSAYGALAPRQGSS
jgi:hypothetical protein